MAKRPFIYTRSAWVDPLTVAGEILARHHYYRHLAWSEYWGLTLPETDRGGRISWWPLVGHELEDAIRLHIHNTRREWASDRLVRHVVEALGLICRNDMREVA
jgi:hypothetical protein